MAFHDTKIHGPMKQHTIVTPVFSASEVPIQKLIVEHDEKVSKFNSEHNVFFNQICPIIRIDNTRILITTVCLYADGAGK